MKKLISVSCYNHGLNLAVTDLLKRYEVLTEKIQVITRKLNIKKFTAKARLKTHPVKI